MNVVEQIGAQVLDSLRPPLNRPLGELAHGERAAALIAKLTAGGDARITLDQETGLNRYYSAPYPRDILAYSSSTVSDISAEAFAHLLALEAAPVQPTYTERLEELRVRIRRAFGLAGNLPVAFAPSGTDLEYIALAAVRGRAVRGIHNILLGADEIGSGCIHSAHGRYFAKETALGTLVEPTYDVAECGPVTLVDVPVRCGEGVARSSGDIAAAMACEIEQARAAGRHSLVHCVHGSKTGLVLPRSDDLAALRKRFGNDVTFVVDACQARITSDAVTSYLDSGCIVLMTGSKFMGAPPFNGWALLPPAMVENAARLPSGFSTIFRRAEFPSKWAGAAALPDSENASLALRLEAAVFELERFQRIPMEQVEAMIAAFEAALTTHLVEPLGIERVRPGQGPDVPDCPIEMRTLATLNVSTLPGLRTFDQAQALHKRLAMDGLRLGQPVKCVRLADGWGGTLRVGLSMPKMSDWAGLSAHKLDALLACDMRSIAAALQQAVCKPA